MFSPKSRFSNLRRAEAHPANGRHAENTSRARRPPLLSANWFHSAQSVLIAVLVLPSLRQTEDWVKNVELRCVSSFAIASCGDADDAGDAD